MHNDAFWLLNIAARITETNINFVPEMCDRYHFRQKFILHSPRVRHAIIPGTKDTQKALSLSFPPASLSMRLVASMSSMIITLSNKGSILDSESKSTCTLSRYTAP